MEKKNIILALIIILIIAIIGIIACNIYHENTDSKLKKEITQAAILENNLINVTSQIKNYTENPNATDAKQLKELVKKSEDLIKQENACLETAKTQTKNETEIEYLDLQSKRLLAIENIINSTNEFSTIVNKYVNGETPLPELIVASSNLKNSIEDNEKIYKDVCSNIKTVLEKNPNLANKLNETNATKGMLGEFDSNILEIE
jgi:hypothetical protein